MLKSSLVISTLIATTIFISPHSLLSGQEETSDTPITTSSAPAKLSIEAQLKEDHFNFSLKMMQWDHDQKEKTETAAPVAVPGLEPETRQQAALRTLLSMRNANGLTPLHRAVLNKRADFTSLLLAALGEEANSRKLLLNGESLLRLVATTSENTQHSDEAVFNTIIALRESGYKFDNSEIRHFGVINSMNNGYLFFDHSDSQHKYIALAILLGADKSATDKGMIDTLSWKVIKNVIPEHYKTLSKKGLAHLVDIHSDLEQMYFDDKKRAALQKPSEEVRQKKSQLQQLAEATERLNLK